MITIGIDPGLTGAIATNTGLVYDIPVVAKGQATGAVKNHVDPRGIYNIIYQLANTVHDVVDIQDSAASTEVVVYLEKQIYRPKINPKTKQTIPQGGSSIFSLGDTYGVLRAACAIAGLRVETPMPTVWKKKMKLTYDKEVCRSKAIDMFPQSYDYLKRKMDHNRAEALLLAKYGELTEAGTL